MQTFAESICRFIVTYDIFNSFFQKYFGLFIRVFCKHTNIQNVMTHFYDNTAHNTLHTVACNYKTRKY